MSKRIGKRVVVWLPEGLIQAIDSERDWRTTSDFIRQTLLESLKPAKVEKPKPGKQSAPTWQEVRDKVMAQLEAEGLSDMMDTNIEILGEQAAWEQYAKTPNAIERMARD